MDADSSRVVLLHLDSLRAKRETSFSDSVYKNVGKVSERLCLRYQPELWNNYHG